MNKKIMLNDNKHALNLSQELVTQCLVFSSCCLLSPSFVNFLIYKFHIVFKTLDYRLHFIT